MSIFLKKSVYKNGKTFLSIVEGHYDPITKNSKQTTIQKLGFVEDLKKKFDDPIDHYDKEAKRMNLARKEESTFKTEFNLNEELTKNDDIKNLGYIFIKKIYEEIGLKDFFNSKQKQYNIKFNLNKIFSLLVFSRILYPGSKKETYDGKEKFFEPFENFSLHDIYRALDYFIPYKEDIETLLWNKTKDKYQRNTDNLYYDCTNYYFEINYNDQDLCDEEGNIIQKGYRKDGPEKNHRPDPIIEMGLLMDATNLPLTYDLFAGNESEKTSLKPITKRTKANLNLGRIILVADRGLNTSDNIFYLNGKNDKPHMDGYIYGQSVRGATQEFKDWVLDQHDYLREPMFNEDGSPKLFRKAVYDKDGFCIGYEKTQEYFKHKSRIYPKEITIKRDGKRNTKVRVDQKQMVYFSQKYADKQKRDRNEMIERAKDLIAHPKKYDRVTAKGAKSYVNNIHFVKNTGEVAEGYDLSLNLEKIAEEEKYDGYYSIVTSELNMSDTLLREKYRNLSNIEDTFKITKSELNDRPVFVWTREHIEAHFLTCFVALVILRLLEKNANEKFSPHSLIESIKKLNATYLSENIYKTTGYNDVVEYLFNSMNIPKFKKFMERKKIKNLLKY